MATQRIELPSLPLVAEVVKAGGAAGVLPGIAHQEFVGAEVREFRPSGMRLLRRPIDLVWNPRMARIRPVLSAVVEALAGCGEPGLSGR
ncbi:MAG: hypothetical protein H7A46_08165 [Verrucomicrobiales bacterium]|nr:hypothetical protein [Verrucomicrobiales bacterium]